MSTWDITPSSVETILTSVENTAENDMSTALADISTEANNAADACTAPSTVLQGGNAPLVASAISEWFTLHETEFNSLSTTTTNVLTNTGQAVNSYLDHDETAALEFQRKAK